MHSWLIEYESLLPRKGFSEKTIIEKKRYLKIIHKQLGNLLLTEVKPIHLRNIIDGYMQADKSSSAKAMHSLLSDLFNDAIIYGLIDNNPIWPLRYPAQRVKRARLLFDEFCELKDHAKKYYDPYLFNVLMLMLVTAQRPGDILNMGRNTEDYFIKDDYLFVHQIKNRKYIIQDGKKRLIKPGSKIALPLDLKLNIIDTSLKDIIDLCTGKDYFIEYKSKKVEYWRVNRDYCHLRDAVFKKEYWKEYNPPSLFEIRSLSERLYRNQGINTQLLLGHKYSSTTDLYNDLRGREWQYLKI